MDPFVLTLLLVGAAGVVLLLLALVIGDFSHLGHPDADGPFSLPALCAFIGGGGFAGAIAATVLDGIPEAWRITGSIGIGLVAAVPLAWLVVRFAGALMRMRTDETLSDSHLMGALGVVISAIPAGGLGEVRLSVAGQQLKYNARAEDALAPGTPVYVIGTPSATSVEVVSVAP
ncbi:hypothetical protein GIS00_17970 [Nakamurella sp. YIM 132087]|uniref:NfeD-like C-terminal domain-containing protein n=1 Tax=Nakamurella alba TaxID=2665158 RepID=A0A7K1FNT1_9ACTN|nr:NfeD family protein [Nakamurella alba]MTD15825.1 hypothetical protein [Nakamurella alba]